MIRQYRSPSSAWRDAASTSPASWSRTWNTGAGSSLHPLRCVVERMAAPLRRDVGHLERRVQEREVGGVEGALARLGPVALLQLLGDEAVGRRHERRTPAPAAAARAPAGRGRPTRCRRARASGTRSGRRGPRRPSSRAIVGMSTHRPSASNFQPWYTQRRPHSSLRPKNRSAPRCAQRRSTSPTRPLVSRNATSSSPSTVTRTGAPSGSGTSRLSSTGIQKRRNSVPIGGPRTRPREQLHRPRR